MIIIVLSQIFTFLVPRLVGVAALAGSLASAFIALAWLSFTFQALLYGAAWVRVRDRNERPASQPAWGVPQRRQNRAVAESDSPQLTQGWVPPRRLGRPGRVGDLGVRLCPQRLDPALWRRRVGSGTAGRWPRRRPAIAGAPATAARRTESAALAAAGMAAGSADRGLGGRIRGDHLPGGLAGRRRPRAGAGATGAGTTGTTGSGSGTTGAGAGAAATTGSGAAWAVSAGSAADEITVAATTASAASTGASCVALV